MSISIYLGGQGGGALNEKARFVHAFFVVYNKWQLNFLLCKRSELHNAQTVAARKAILFEGPSPSVYLGRH